VRTLVFAVVAVAAGCDLDAPAPPPASSKPPAAAAANPKAREECRDACEQQVILAHSGDEALRACRAACENRYGAATPAPHEVPSRITRAPARYHAPAVRPR
jgi:hypothetical protein